MLLIGINLQGQRQKRENLEIGRLLIKVEEQRSNVSHQLDEKANKAHHEKTSAGCHGNLGKF